MSEHHVKMIIIVETAMKHSHANIYYVLLIQ